MHLGMPTGLSVYLLSEVRNLEVPLIHPRCLRVPTRISSPIIYPSYIPNANPNTM